MLVNKRQLVFFVQIPTLYLNLTAVFFRKSHEKTAKAK